MQSVCTCQAESLASGPHTSETHVGRRPLSLPSPPCWLWSFFPLLLLLSDTIPPFHFLPSGLGSRSSEPASLNSRFWVKRYHQPQPVPSGAERVRTRAPYTGWVFPNLVSAQPDDCTGYRVLCLVIWNISSQGCPGVCCSCGT